MEPPLVRGLSSKQPEEKEGQIGKSLSGPFVSIAPPHSHFLPLSWSSLNTTLSHFIQSGLWPQMQTQEQCLHPSRGNVMSSSSPSLIFSCSGPNNVFKLFQVLQAHSSLYAKNCTFLMLVHAFLTFLLLSFEKAIQYVLAMLWSASTRCWLVSHVSSYCSVGREILSEIDKVMTFLLRDEAVQPLLFQGDFFLSNCAKFLVVQWG